MSRHNAGEQAASYQRLFPCPPCRPMIRNNKVFTQSLSLENYIKFYAVVQWYFVNRFFAVSVNVHIVLLLISKISRRLQSYSYNFMSKENKL